MNWSTLVRLIACAKGFVAVVLIVVCGLAIALAIGGLS
jgi:hypothetical protein